MSIWKLELRCVQSWTLLQEVSGNMLATLIFILDNVIFKFCTKRLFSIYRGWCIVCTCHECVLYMPGMCFACDRHVFCLRQECVLHMPGVFFHISGEWFACVRNVFSCTRDAFYLTLHC